MAQMAQMNSRKRPDPTLTGLPPCGCKVNPSQVSDHLRHLRDLRIQTSFSG